MIERLVHLLFIGASTLAAGLLAYLVLTTAAQIARWFLQRRKPWWMRVVEHQGAHLKPIAPQGRSMPRLLLLGAAIGLAFKAALTGGVLVGIYLACVGIVLYIYLGRRASSLSHERIAGELGELVAAYYSAYLVMSTVFNALSEAVRTITNPHLRSAVQRTLDAFAAGQSAEQALDQLVAQVGDSYVAQFAFILRHTSESNQTETLSALQALGKRLDQRQRLKDRSRVALALVAGTVRFLQSANGVMIALAVLAPFWWNFYSASISHQAQLMAAVTATLIGSWHFENQLRQLRERVL